MKRISATFYGVYRTDAMTFIFLTELFLLFYLLAVDFSLTPVFQKVFLSFIYVLRFGILLDYLARNERE